MKLVPPIIGFVLIWSSLIFNRPGGAGAVLYTTSLSFIKLLIHPFPPDLQNIINPKLLELGSYNFETIFTPTMCHLSDVRCHVSGVVCHVSWVRCQVSDITFFVQIVGASGASGGSVIIGSLFNFPQN